MCRICKIILINLKSLLKISFSKKPNPKKNSSHKTSFLGFLKIEKFKNQTRKV